MRFGQFQCEHLTASDKTLRDIAGFTVIHQRTGGGLATYLQELALPDETAGAMRTYIVRKRSTTELAGYFSLKAGLMSFKEGKEDGVEVFDTLPGVELANFALDGAFLQKYPNSKGLGKLIFGGFILPIIQQAAIHIGVSLVYLFALPQPALLRTYEKYGFCRLKPGEERKLHRRLKPNYDQSCIFMFQPLSAG